jgi:hypothetical protein
MPTDEGRSLHELEVEIEEELDLAGATSADGSHGFSPAESLFDPFDVQREEIGLRNLLGAVEALARDVEPGDPSAVDGGREADVGSTPSR